MRREVAGRKRRSRSTLPAKPDSFALSANQSCILTVSIVTTRATVNNVLAYLPGKTNEYVIIGAHYDHLGRGNFDSLAPSQIGQIHPGADDNASGTAGRPRTGASAGAAQRTVAARHFVYCRSPAKNSGCSAQRSG